MTQSLCRLDDIEDGQARGFTLAGGLEIFVIRVGSRVFGYLNSCPHQGTPLDWTPDRFISRASGNILCATHGAQFRIDDGLCVSGPCKGEHLRPIRARVNADGQIVVDAPDET